MNLAQLKNTIRNFIAGKASGPEKSLVEEWLREAEQAAEREEDKGQYDGRKSIVLTSIHNHIYSRPPFIKTAARAPLKRLLPRTKWAAAACLLLAGVASYLLRFEIMDFVSPLPLHVVTTNAYEVREIRLPDSSVVVMNVNSTLSYPGSFRGKRMVALQGEAFFEVSKDAGHPFVVNGAHLRIKVLGTSFTLSDKTSDGKASIILRTGSVQVIAPGSDAAFPVLHPRQQLLYTAASRQGAIKNGVEADQGWTDKILIFKESKLKEVFAAIEKTYDTHITLSNVAIADKLFTGSFIKGDNVASIMKILSLSYGFSIQQQNDRFVLQ